MAIGIFGNGIYVDDEVIAIFLYDDVGWVNEIFLHGEMNVYRVGILLIDFLKKESGLVSVISGRFLLLLPLSFKKSGALENEGMGILEFKAGAELNEGAFINS